MCESLILEYIKLLSLYLKCGKPTKTRILNKIWIKYWDFNNNVIPIQKALGMPLLLSISVSLPGTITIPRIFITRLVDNSYHSRLIVLQFTIQINNKGLFLQLETKIQSILLALLKMKTSMMICQRCRMIMKMI